ncbi:MAG: bacteriohemerythrin [Microbacter sp.]
MESSTYFSSKGAQWNDSYLLNIPLIDTQHQRFFVLFDQMETMMRNNVKNNAYFEVINELEKYTHYHFSTEERLMREAHIDEAYLAYHVAQHQLFVKKVEEFQIAESYDNSVLFENLLLFMRKWFLGHIKGTDSKYADAIRAYLISKKD